MVVKVAVWGLSCEKIIDVSSPIATDGCLRGRMSGRLTQALIVLALAHLTAAMEDVQTINFLD